MLEHDGLGLFNVALSVDFGRVQAFVAEDDLCCFNSKRLAEPCRPSVTELVRVPVGHDPLFGRNLRLRSVSRLIGFAARLANCMPVALVSVVLSRLTLWPALSVSAGPVALSQRRSARGGP